MDREEILRRFTGVVIDRLKVQEDEVTESANFEEDLGADWTDVIDLMIGTEEEFEIEIPDKDFEKVKTVSQAIAYLMGRASELLVGKPKPWRGPKLNEQY